MNNRSNEILETELKKIEEFLIHLDRLTAKYGIIIHSSSKHEFIGFGISLAKPSSVNGRYKINKITFALEERIIDVEWRQD